MGPLSPVSTWHWCISVVLSQGAFVLHHQDQPLKHTHLSLRTTHSSSVCVSGGQTVYLDGRFTTAQGHVYCTSGRGVLGSLNLCSHGWLHKFSQSRTNQSHSHNTDCTCWVYQCCSASRRELGAVRPGRTASPHPECHLQVFWELNRYLQNGQNIINGANPQCAFHKGGIKLSEHTLKCV